MCSTCNHKNFVPYEATYNGKPVIRLKGPNEFLDIHCDLQGKNYKIGQFTIYRCPTCGNKLY